LTEKVASASPPSSLIQEYPAKCYALCYFNLIRTSLDLYTIRIKRESGAVSKSSVNDINLSVNHFKNGYGASLSCFMTYLSLSVLSVIFLRIRSRINNFYSKKEKS